MTDMAYDEEMAAIARKYDVIDKAVRACRLAAASTTGHHREALMAALEHLEPLHSERGDLEYEAFLKAKRCGELTEG
jgi:hypothetical protein